MVLLDAALPALPRLRLLGFGLHLGLLHLEEIGDGFLGRDRVQAGGLIPFGRFHWLLRHGLSILRGRRITSLPWKRRPTKDLSPSALEVVIPLLGFALIVHLIRRGRSSPPVA